MPLSESQVKELKERYDSLQAIRAPWETLWEEISRYVMPRRAPGQCGTLLPSNEKESRLFDITAVQANMVLANGCVAWMSPMEGAWFSFTEIEGVKDDALVQWLSACTERSRNKLARSNFYTQVHEFYLDRGAFGTAALYMEEGKKNPLNVQCWPTGTFVIDEDDEGDVDTVIRLFKLTPRQAKMKFGEENLSKKTRELLASKDAKANEPQEYLHYIMPREERDATKLDALNMPIASIYVEKESNHVCKEGGYPEMPVFVSRYLEWGSGMGRLYGWSPAFAALPEARQLNFLQKMMDALAEKSAFPPILAPEELEGEIDPNAAGVTYFSSNLAQGNMPKEWMTQGRYDVGKDRVLERQKAINQAFHVDLFQMFAALTKQMTAREVSERSNEKLIQFSPTFARLVTELFNPFLARLFGIGLRGGWFGKNEDIPQSALVPLGDGLFNIAPPTVQYTSRIAQALRSLPVLSLHRMIELGAAMVQATGSTAVFDNLDMDESFRMAANVESLPEGMLVDKSKRDENRAAQAQQVQEAQQLEAAQSMADAASKLGKVPKESTAGKVLESQLTAA